MKKGFREETNHYREFPCEFVVILILDYSLLFVKAFLYFPIFEKGGFTVIYENIKNLCDKKGISIAALEKACGLGNATIRGWVDSSPRVDRLKPVADYFGVSIDDLLKEPAG